MDTQKLRSQVFEKTGVKIDLDDPVFAVVALNELVLEEAIERISEQTKGGKAKRPTKAEQEAQKKLDEEARRFPNAADKRMMLISGGAALFGALVVLAGQALWFRPAAQPAPVIQARELTPAQTAALAEAEKLSRAIEKLDAKSRATIQSELKKP
jgi:hypothetical protein